MFGGNVSAEKARSKAWVSPASGASRVLAGNLTAPGGSPETAQCALAIRAPHRYTARMGTLYYGDNLDILTRYIADESVDLVYLDPPFNSAQNYTAFFQEKDGTAAAAQIQAFVDIADDESVKNAPKAFGLRGFDLANNPPLVLLFSKAVPIVQ